MIFTEFKGTVQSIRKQDGHRLNQLVNTEGCNIVFRSLTGEMDLGEARKTLSECADFSMKEDRYPVLICTPAGEVGINMAWATTLVHWDLNPNPQRLEQRTWRLDRRLHPTRDSHFREEYLVLIPVFSSRPVIQRLRESVEERWEASRRQLGLENRTYLPEDGERDITPGSSGHNADILDQEVREASVFVTNQDLSELDSVGRWMHESECIRGRLSSPCSRRRQTSARSSMGRTSP